MHLEADDRLPGAHRHLASVRVRAARSSACAMRMIVRLALHRPDAAGRRWGGPVVAPDGQRQRRAPRPGSRCRRKTSLRYIASGSARFSPSLNAGVGVVGVNSACTPDAKTRGEVGADRARGPAAPCGSTRRSSRRSARRCRAGCGAAPRRRSRWPRVARVQRAHVRQRRRPRAGRTARRRSARGSTSASAGAMM